MNRTIKINLSVLVIAALIMQLMTPSTRVAAEEDISDSWAEHEIQLLSPDTGELFVSWSPYPHLGDVDYQLSIHEGEQFTELVTSGQTRSFRWGRAGLSDSRSYQLTIVAQDDSGQQLDTLTRPFTLSELEGQSQFTWNAALSSEQHEDSTVTFHWNRHEHVFVTQYYLVLYGEDDFVWTSPRQPQGYGLSVTTPELEPGHYAVWLFSGGTNIVTGFESITSSYHAVLHVTGEEEPGPDDLPPYWPENAELMLEDQSTTSLTISWPQAQDDIAMYRIMLNGVERESVNASTRQVVLSNLASGHHYDVSVVAEDTSGGTSAPLEDTFQTSHTTMELRWSAAEKKSGADRYLKFGEDIRMELKGDAGYEAKVLVSYQSWLNEAGQVTNQLRSMQRWIPLEESLTEPGVYRGAFALDEALAIAEVTALRGVIQQDDVEIGVPIEASVGLQVTGSIHIRLQPGGGDISPVSIVLQAGEDRHTLTANAAGTYSFREMLPNTSYQATVKQLNGGRVLKHWLIDPVHSSKSVHETLNDMRSSELQIIVKDQAGQPAPDASVTLRRTDGTSMKRMNTDSQGAAAFEGLPLLEGDQLLVNVANAPAHSLNKRDVPVELQAGLNVIDIELEQRSQVRYYGIVDYLDESLSGFPLTFVQTHPTRPGEKVIQQVSTDGAGSYHVYLYEGMVELTGSTVDYALGTLRRQVGNTDVEWNLPTGRNMTAEIGYTISTKLAGGDWVSKDGAAMTYEERAAYRAFLYDSKGSLVRQGQQNYPLTTTGKEGDVFRLCMESTRYNLMSSCQEVILDGTRSGHAVFHFDTDGGQATARFDDSLRDGSWIMTVYDEAGRFSRTYPITAEGEWKEYLPHSGQYVMRIEKPSKVQQQICITCSAMPNPAGPGEIVPDEGLIIHIPFTVPSGGGLNLGMINLSSGDPIADKQGLLIRSAALAPGASFDLRLLLSADDIPAHDGMAIRLEWPEHTSLVADSLMMGGKPLHAAQWSLSEDGRQLLIQAGALEEGADLIIHAKLKLGMNYTASEAIFRAEGLYTIGSSEQSERLGEQRVPVRHIIMDVPPRTVNPSTDAFGWAVPGSTVSVYHDENLLGQTIASSEGTWNLKLHLPSPSTDFIYILSATATLDDKAWLADSRAVWYRQDAPYIESVRLTSDGSGKTFYPQNGISRVPYTLNFGLMEVDVKFNDPDAISGVAVRIGGSVLQTVYNALTESYTAATMVGYGNISRFHGPVYVSYNEVSRAGAADKPIRTEAELRAALPWWMKDIELPQEDDVAISKAENEEVRSLSLSIPRLGEDATATTTFTVTEDVDYNVAGKPRMSGEGMTIYGYDMEVIKGDDYQSPFAEPITGWRDSKQMLLNHISQGDHSQSSYKLRVTNYMEYDGTQSLNDGGQKRTKQVQALAFPYAKVAAGVIETEIKAYDHYSTATGAKGFVDLLDSLNNEIDQAYSACGMGAAQRYHSELENIMEDAMLAETGKWAAMGAGTAAGALLPGAGLLATGLIFASSYFYGKIIDKSIADRLQNVKNNMKQDQECKKEETEKPQKRAVQDEMVADPTWIYDPSGYVYEANADNRLSGVTATLLQFDEADSAWTEWDAERFGQINPQVSNHEGKYGWDVPQGLWKVRYEKLGYETTYSEELTVLPPHFDVNIPMVTLHSPEVTRVYSDNGGSSIEIEFTQYMNTASFALHPPFVHRDGELIEGAWQPVNAVPGEGQQLARSFSFQPEQGVQLQVADVLQLDIDNAMKGYNDLPVSGALSYSVEVTATDVHPPSAPAAAAATAGDHEIYVSWRDPLDGDLNEIEVEWRLSGQQSYQSLKIDKGIRLVAIRNVSPHTLYELRISALDDQGNRSNYMEITGSAGEAVQYAGSVQIPHVTEASVVPGPSSLDIRWEEPPGSLWQEVRVNWKSPSEEAFTEGVRVPKGTRNFVITGLNPKQEYEVMLTVEDDSGLESSPFLLQAATTEIAVPSEPPVGIPGNGSDETDHAESWMAWSELAGGKALNIWNGELLISMLHGQEAKEGDGGLRIIKRNELARPRQDRYWAEGPVYEFQLEPSSQSGWLGPLTVQFNGKEWPLSEVDVYKLALYRLTDEESGQWEYVGGVWHAGAGRLEAQVKREGVYAVMAYRPSFMDLHNHWANVMIGRLASHHLIEGVGNDSFAPSRDITRAEMATLLIRLVERETGKEIAMADDILSDYRDIESGKWYMTILHKAVSSGLMTGSEGYMRPDEALTREEAAELTLRAAKLAFGGKLTELSKEAFGTLSFADQAEIAEWARYSVQALSHLEIVKGFPDGRFAPKSSLSRAQAASLLWEIYQMRR